MRGRPWLVLALGSSGLIACPADDTEPAAGVVRTDSAGVTFVTHPEATATDTLLEPVLTIGRAGETDYEFFRVVHVAALGSGNVVVANGGTSELMFYGPDGDFVRRLGRRGEGPAEFGFLSTLSVRRGDTLMVGDSRRRRLLHFDSAGVYARGESFAEDLTDTEPTAVCVFPGIFGVFADGTRLTRGWGCMQFDGSDGLRPAMTTVALANGERRDTIGRFSTHVIWERGGADPGPDQFEMFPFGPLMSWAVGPDRAYLSFGEEYEIRAYDSEAGLLGVLGEAGAPPLVNGRDIDLLREDRIERDSPLDDDVPFPERMGGYARLIVSHEGDVWAQRALGPSEGDLQLWTVFSSDGSERSRIVLPDMRLHSIRDGKLYGTVTDDLGVHTVWVLALPAHLTPSAP